MTRLETETLTDVTTTQKISVGVLVATASFVALSAIAAAVYTLSVPRSSTTTAEQAPAVQLDPSADRTIQLAP